MVYLKLLLTMALWGGTFIAGRTLSQTLSPYSAAFCRFAVAAVGMVLLLWSQGERLPRLKATQILPVVVLGLSGVLVYNVCFFSGLQTITASRAGLIIALNPIFITLCSALLFRQPLPPLSLAGTAVALLGAALVLSEGQLQTLLSQGVSQGDLWLLGCVGSWVVYSLVGKQVMGSLSPLATATYSIWVGAIALFPLAIHQGLWQSLPVQPWVAWVGVFYLGLLGTVLGFSWYYEGIQALGAPQAAIFINLVPVFAVTFGVLLLREPFSGAMSMGGGLVVLGVVVVNWPQTQQPLGD
ncbi:MAG: DMT family transporter [Leptolyngbyaceae cyanobacterium]